jgi:hypothetical protein
MAVTVWALVLGLALLNQGRASLQSPQGYRFPTEADFSDSWQEFRSKIPTPFRVRADFNGDGRRDEAWIVLAEKGDGWALVAFLATAGSSPKTMLLEKGSGPAQRYGMAPVPPGKYRTACGKGYWECRPGEPEVLNLRLPTIEFCVYESACSIFWWDVNKGQFQRTQISD